jgi:hypothetical protein
MVWCSPFAWGCTVVQIELDLEYRVFPAQVGMDRPPRLLVTDFVFSTSVEMGRSSFRSCLKQMRVSSPCGD